MLLGQNGFNFSTKSGSQAKSYVNKMNGITLRGSTLGVWDFSKISPKHRESS